MSTAPAKDSSPDQITYDLSASIDALPPRRPSEGQDLIGAGGVPIGRPANGFHSRQKSKTEFLDLADSSNRLGSAPEIVARLEQKRMEHERQRADQQRVFDAQMKALQEQQESEERELMKQGTSLPKTPPHGGNGTVDGPPGRSRSGNDLANFGSIGTGTSIIRDNSNNSKSVPGSRRHSGGENKEVVDSLGLETLSLSKDSALAAPFASKLAARIDKSTDHTGAPSVTSFLFDDEDSDLHAFGGRYLQMNNDDDKFPILVRRDSYPNMLSASSAALDLAAPRNQTPPHGTTGGFTRPSRAADWSPFDPPSKKVVDADRNRSASGNSLPYPDPLASPVSERGASPRLARVANLGATNRALGSAVSNSCTSPSQEKKPNVFLSPAATSLAGASGADHVKSSLGNPYHAGGIEFGSIRPQPSEPGFGYNMEQAFGSYNVNGGPFGFDDSYGSNVTDPLNPMFAGKPRRDPESSRFANIRLEDMQGDMFSLCKDQHGCRFLQKKLEEGDAKHRDMIFAEIYPHFGELMTDAFGNYLAQKAFEYCTDDQRDLLIESISGELVSIALNMHGTRAVQRIIDLLSTQRQVQSLIHALNMNVVTLIKDLNANHAIQKLLNHLPPEDNQFIFNSVAANCIEVATHRHGCCVLQRCIDHASESQRIQLVTEITYNALVLVQDPFANYVVQYVLDLNDSRFIEAIVHQFTGNVCALSMQKFSSNVVEKCIRVSDLPGRRMMIEELSGRQRLERLLRDSFANYVVQTALDYAEPNQRANLVDNIRPILPLIRNTPYGKRIQSKLGRESVDPLRGPTYHPALVSGGYFIAPPHMPGHPPHPHSLPTLMDGRTGTPFHPQLIPAHPGAMAAFHPQTAGWAGQAPVPIGFPQSHESQASQQYAPFM